MMTSCLQRKYVDLMRYASSNWANWDSLVDIRVGAYGSIDQETGDFRVEGNIYDPKFQAELDKHGAEVKMSDFPPQEGQVKDDLVVASQGVHYDHTYLCDRCQELEVHTFRELVDGQWIFTFTRGKRGGVLIMHRPRQILLPSVVLEPLYKVDKLRDKWLVTSTHACPAYSMYLSDTSGDKVTLTYLPKCPIAGVTVKDTDGGSAWHVDAQTGLFRKACNISGDNSYMPLFEAKHPVRYIEQASPNDLWLTTFPPWELLDEDGGEDPIDVNMVEDSDSDIF